MIPEFRRDGKLPPGLHPAKWQEFVQRFGQTQHREQLLVGLLLAARLLKLAGCRTLYVDGSFVTTKPEPGLPAPVFFDFANERAAQKTQFGGELFPAQLPEGGTGRTWLEFFQRDRDGRRKGIVALDLESVP